MDLNYDGLIAEIHPNPSKALNDADQPSYSAYFKELLTKLSLGRFKHLIQNLTEILNRFEEIDQIDEKILSLLSEREWHCRTYRV